MMPEAAQDIQDNLELEARVGALLDELAVAQAAADKVSELAASDSPAPPPVSANGVNGHLVPAPPPAPPHSPPNASKGNHLPPVDAATAVAIAPVPPIMPAAPLPSSSPAKEREHGTPVAPSAVASAAEPEAGKATDGEQDLAKAVEKLLEAANPPPAAAVAVPAAETPAAPAAETGEIESLDAELAGLADDLIAGEFADEDGVLKEDPPAAAAAPGPSTDGAATPAALAPEAVKPSIEAAAAAAAVAAPAPKAVATAPTATKKPETSASPVVSAEPSLPLRAAAAISSPIHGRPQYVRGIIAWAALVNVFLALCVWAYVLVFRPPEAPVPTAEPGHGDKAAAHGEKSGGHDAKKPAKSDGHSAPAKKKPPAKDAGHESTAKASGGHH